MSEQKKIDFTVACVNEFAQQHNLSIQESFRYLFQFKGIAFIKENYEVEHTLDFGTIVEDLRMLCRKNGGVLNILFTRKRGLGFCERRMISMSKQDQLIEYIVQDIVDMLATDQNIEYDEAMNKFYNSEVFEKLQDKETGLYLESSEYIYDLFKDEMNFGHIIQSEI